MDTFTKYIFISAYLVSKYTVEQITCVSKEDIVDFLQCLEISADDLSPNQWNRKYLEFSEDCISLKNLCNQIIEAGKIVEMFEKDDSTIDSASEQLTIKYNNRRGRPIRFNDIPDMDISIPFRNLFLAGKLQIKPQGFIHTDNVKLKESITVEAKKCRDEYLEKIHNVTNGF